MALPFRNLLLKLIKPIQLAKKSDRVPLKVLTYQKEPQPHQNSAPTPPSEPPLQNNPYHLPAPISKKGSLIDHQG